MWHTGSRVTKNQIREKAMILFLERSFTVKNAMVSSAVREKRVPSSNRERGRGKELKEESAIRLMGKRSSLM